MDPELFLTHIFCLVDDLLPRQPLRQRGFAPALSDSEVLTMELVGEFLGLEKETDLYRFFRWHYAHLFPAIRKVHRTSVTRQMANLWGVKYLVWRRVLGQVRFDPFISILDSMPVPICRFSRAKRSRLFAGEASYGKDSLQPGTYYGFRFHVRICWPGVITGFEITAANGADVTAAADLLEQVRGWALGDRAYASKLLKEQKRAEGLLLLTPAQTRKHEKVPWPFWLMLKRRRVETVLGQLVERFRAKRTWARDLWHLCSRWLRKVLAHTVGVFLCQQHGLPDLHLRDLIAA
jgi:hypothetical protein